MHDLYNNDIFWVSALICCAIYNFNAIQKVLYNMCLENILHNENIQVLRYIVYTLTLVYI